MGNEPKICTLILLVCMNFATFSYMAGNQITFDDDIFGCVAANCGTVDS